MHSTTDLFENAKLYQFMKHFISYTINEINNEYNMSFIRFVFKEEDLDIISSKLDLENERIAGVNIKFFIGLGLIGIFGIIGLIAIAPYRMDRITSFIDPWSDPLGTGFQIIQSLYAIGPGGLLGQGFLNSRQKQFYLPEPQTDFIFSIISEEFGFLGVVIVVSLFLIILYRGIKIALNSKNEFSKYLAFGMIFQILIQAVMNLMVVIGLIPVTGVTLPFLSYGGSSLLISMISIGILLNISKQ